MDYEVKIREMPDTKVMSKRFVTNIETIGKEMPVAYETLFNYLKEQNAEMTHECYAAYYADTFDPLYIDVACSFGVKKDVPETDAFKNDILKGGTVATVIHKGPYSSLESAYDFIMKWMEENGYQPLMPMYESYLNKTENLEEALTEIIWPVKKK